MSRLPLGSLVVAGVLVAGAVVATAAAPQGGRSTGAKDASVEVVGATAVCPDLRQSSTLATRVSVGVAPLPAGRTARTDVGKVQAATIIDSGADTPVGVEGPGEVAVGLGTRTDKDALSVTATGELAAGLEVEQVTRGETGRERGLAGLRCEPPRTDTWFVGGGGTTGDDTSVLVLVNPDATPATVDLDLIAAPDADGATSTDQSLGQGITVQPRSRLGIQLDTLVLDRSFITVHVHARRGRVAAGLRRASSDGNVPRGVDWVPVSSGPATRVVVPGIPAGPGARRLLLTNPSEDDTVVSVQVTTSDAQFVPTGLSEVSVPARSSLSVSLDPIARDTPVTAVVTSDVPVLAGVLVLDRQAGQVEDFAFGGSTLPLSGPALITDVVIDRPTESTLVLTALDGDATVAVTPIRVLRASGAGGLPAPKTVKVPGGRTVALKLSTFYPPGTEAQLAVEVRPLDGSGPVYAARYLRERGAHGPLVTLLDLQGPAQRVSRPTVVEDRRVAD